MHMNKKLTGIGLVALALICATAEAATQFSAADYDLYPGDFNGDGKTDLLYIAKTPDKPSGIALANSSGNLQLGFQSWPANYLNIPWSSGVYTAIVADFNGDGRADILLQRSTAGNSYLLFANGNANNGPIGQIQGISQSIAQTAFGVGWSSDQHRIVAGDFNGDGKADLFFQSAVASGTNAVVLANSNGLFDPANGTSNCGYANGPQQCWTDGYKGFNWSTRDSVVYAANFGGDSKADLLIQAKPHFVMIDYDVPFPVPTFKPQSFGVLLAQADNGSGIFRTLDDVWNWNERGINWSPSVTNLVIGDFNGDGKADIFAQSRSAGRANMLLLENGSGTGVVQTAISVASNIGSYTGNSYRLTTGYFGGSSVAVLYAQATTASGSNFYTGNISAGGGSTYASSMQIAPSLPAPATVVGATAGAASVSSTGVATYAIPIELPRGTADLTPKLSLSYQHSTKNGLLGVGWGIGGLSIITRCPKTVAQDGATQGVQLVATDQYCLDGNRLRLTSGSQGADASQYRTELETYSLIIAHGNATNGPLWFEVKRKDGLTYEYGSSTDSRVAVSGTSTTRVWALSKIRDRASNYIAFSYFNNNLNASCQETVQYWSYHPCQIQYTGNSDHSIAPAYTVQFVYEDRNTGENVVHYYGGGYIQELKRLKRIELRYAGTVVHDYRLTYVTPSSFSPVSRISSIQECGYAGGCLPATSFTWSDMQVSGGVPAVSATGIPDPAPGGTGFAFQPIAVDLDGDGLLDRVANWRTITGSGSDLTVFWGSKPGQTPRASQTFTGLFNIGVATDVDGDGKQDVLVYQDNAGTLTTMWLHELANGSLVLENAPAFAVPATGIDVDGDGFQDQIIQSDSMHLYVRFHNHDGSPGYESTTHPAWTAPSGYTIMDSAFPWWALQQGLRQLITTADVDGDGRQDVLVQVQNTSLPSNGGWLVLYSNGAGFVTGDLLVPRSTGSIGSGTLTFYTPNAIDINGDGCTDFIYPISGTYWQLATSKCQFNGSVGLNPPAATSISTGNTVVGVVDFNQDGYQDAIYAQSDGIHAALSTGTTLAGQTLVGSTSAAWTVDIDGDGLSDKSDSSSGNPIYYPAVGPKADLLLSATDGFGNKTTFTYAPLTDSSVYTRGSGGAGVNQDFGGPMYVVKQAQSTDGVGGTYTLSYSYQQARRNVQGRGFLGFAKRTITDSRTGTVTEETYDQSITSSGANWERAGRLIESKVRQSAGGSVVQDTVYTWAVLAPDGAANRRYPYIQAKVVSKYELNNGSSPFVTTATTTTIDNYGTPYDVTTTVVENGTGLFPSSSATFRTYTPTTYIVNDTTNWCLSRREQIQDIRSHTLTNGGSITRTVNQTWDFPHCRITDRVVAPNSGLQLNTHFDYDGFNNVWKTTISGDGIVGSRMTETNYGSDGHFLQFTKNAKQQQTSYTWEPQRALRATETVVDTNSRTTIWTYDPNFSRVIRIQHPDGTSTRQSYAFCNAGNSYCGDSLLRFMTETSEQNASDVKVSYSRVYADSLGRPKYEQELSFNGALSTAQTMYDDRGNVASRSVPYFAGTEPYRGSSFSYDLLGRLTKTQRPVSDADQSLQTETTVYNGLTVTHSDVLGHAQTQVSNAWGQVVQAVDQASQSTTYTYNAFGELKSVADPASNATSLTYYDARGFKQYSDDPDMGHWEYTYDALGEMLTQTDAKGQTTTFVYDSLGRISKRKDPPGTTSDETNWNWDTASNGVGQLGSVTSPGGYSETYTYDALGRRSIVTTVAGTQGTYQTDYAYNASLGTLSTITYPASFNGASSSRYAVQYSYQNGYLKDVRDASNSNLLWQTDALDARGNVIQESYGNGQSTYANFDETNGRLNYIQTGPSGGSATQNLYYQWDRVGNMLSRRDANQNLTETFGYDALYRLTSTQVAGLPAVTMTYDAIGNITSKSDVGTGSYNYNTAQAGCDYTGLTAQPHAVRNAGGTVYCYDKNGDMISRSGAAVTWTTYNYPQTISQGGGNSSTFYYNADRGRYRQIRVDGTITEDVIYVGNVFEKMMRGGTTEYRHSIVANGRIVAIVLRSTNQADSNVLYLHDDHLGSTDVISKATGASFKTSFDAWGNRRASTWNGAPTSDDKSAITATTHRGFTGEEQLDNLNLIHLNGRVYDPVMGRFLSADPIVQDPYHSQSFNRYAYVWNNPLNATDPTGFAGEPVTSASPVIQDALDEVTVTAHRVSDAQINSAQYSATDYARTLQQQQTQQQQLQFQRQLQQQVSKWDQLSLRDRVVYRLLGVTPYEVDTSSDEYIYDQMISFHDGTAAEIGPATAGVMAGTTVAKVVVAKGGLKAAIGATIKAVIRVAKGGGQLLYRYRNGAETATRLARGAADAEAKIGVHGVSVTTNPVAGRPCAVACRDAVEKVFPVLKTGADPNHYTVVLPKPVTKEVAEQFNQLFRDVP